MENNKADLSEEDIYKMNSSIDINISYPYSDEYDYHSTIETIDLDVECNNDVKAGDGFIVSAPMNTNKKDMKNKDGIYSTRFGQRLGDKNPFSDRYSCECGYLKSRINHNIKCPVCNTICKFVDDNFHMFGWIRLNDEYHAIHPKFYATLNYIFGDSKWNPERKMIKGKRLENIINHSPEVDEHGFTRPCEFKPDTEPFYGIGMIDFYERFDEVLDYYIKKYPKKKPYYDEIQRHRYYCDCRHLFRFKKYYYIDDNDQTVTDVADIGTICPICNTPVHWVDKDVIFTHSIPVFTTHLRPTDVKGGEMYYEPTNGLYNLINKHVHSINRVRRKLDRDQKQKNAELYRMQMKWMELTEEVLNILKGKKGKLRQMIGGKKLPTNMVTC